MTAAAPAQRRVIVRRYHATGSTLLAIGLSLLLITLGYGLKLVVESSTAQVSGAGVVALAPSSWQTTANPNELVVRHPADEHTLYAASVVPNQTGGELVDVAQATTNQRSSLLLGFHVTDQGPIRLGDREGYRIRYVYLTPADRGSSAELIEGVDIYLPADGGVIAVSYEAPQAHFADDYAGFERFAASARGVGQ